MRRSLFCAKQPVFDGNERVTEKCQTGQNRTSDRSYRPHFLDTVLTRKRKIRIEICESMSFLNSGNGNFEMPKFIFLQWELFPSGIMKRPVYGNQSCPSGIQRNDSSLTYFSGLKCTNTLKQITDLNIVAAGTARQFSANNQAIKKINHISEKKTARRRQDKIEIRGLTPHIENLRMALICRHANGKCHTEQCANALRPTSKASVLGQSHPTNRLIDKFHLIDPPDFGGILA